MEGEEVLEIAWMLRSDTREAVATHPCLDFALATPSVKPQHATSVVDYIGWWSTSNNLRGLVHLGTIGRVCEIRPNWAKNFEFQFTPVQRSLEKCSFISLFPHSPLHWRILCIKYEKVITQFDRTGRNKHLLYSTISFQHHIDNTDLLFLLLDSDWFKAKQIRQGLHFPFRRD